MNIMLITTVVLLLIACALVVLAFSGSRDTGLGWSIFALGAIGLLAVMAAMDAVLWLFHWLFL